MVLRVILGANFQIWIFNEIFRVLNRLRNDSRSHFSELVFTRSAVLKIVFFVRGCGIIVIHRV